MAYTKIFAVSHHLARTVSYAADPDKTELAGKLDYALNPDKIEGEHRLFQSVLNCASPETAYSEMMATKVRFGQTEGRQAYHLIQSFAHDEVTPEQAHAIGVQLAQRLFGDKYEVVVGTHLDKQHLHSHIVVNSVSCVDGKKYHSSLRSYYAGIRRVSDELCRENNLSVIQPKGKGKHYAEWAAEQAGAPTVRSLIKADVDDAIRSAFNFNTFIEQLKQRGYAIKWGPNVKHIAVKPKGGQRHIRLYSLGEDYTEDAIKARIANAREGPAPAPVETGQPPQPPVSAAVFHFHARPHKRPHPRLAGFIALYWRYCYLLKGAATRKLPNRAAFLLRDEIRKFDQYQAQFLYLYKHGIEDLEALQEHSAAIEQRIEVAVAERQPLYRERRVADDAERDSLTAEINRLTNAIRTDRRSLALCRKVEENSMQVLEVCRQVDEVAPSGARQAEIERPNTKKTR